MGEGGEGPGNEAIIHSGMKSVTHLCLKERIFTAKVSYYCCVTPFCDL